MSDEHADFKRIMLKLDTHKKSQEVSNRVSYDELILAIIRLYSYKRDQYSGGEDQLEQIAVSDIEMEEDLITTTILCL